VIEYRPELGVGDEADADYLQSATGLVWRVVAVMLVLLLLLTFANWLGS
jgi:adenosylcobinamide-phosphate synthase